MAVDGHLQAMEPEELASLMEIAPMSCNWERFCAYAIEQLDRWHRIAPLGLDSADVDCLRASRATALEWITDAHRPQRVVAVRAWLVRHLRPQQCTELTRRLPSSRPARRRRVGASSNG